ncbi:MAG TPA: hypothetical protein VNT26_13685, partial [Candidatus Sulfotelmatobacter sp.]|nr:hypothetical protein [Candidatus Sulfotelmatobacter sp.]
MFCRIVMGGLICWVASLACTAAEAEENWPRWRGPHDKGSTAQGKYPVKWDATKVLWQAPLPGKG